MNDSQQLNEIYKALAQACQREYERQGEEVRAECSTCIGTGTIIHGSTCWSVPCPTCTPRYDELMDKAKGYEWHEVKYVKNRYICTCGKLTNKEGLILDCISNTNYPTFTVESICDTLRDLGLWEAFVEWHGTEIILGASLSIWCHKRESVENANYHDTNAEILTTPSLLGQAATNFIIREE